MFWYSCSINTTPGPLLYNPVEERAVRQAMPQEFAELQQRYDTTALVFTRRALRGQAIEMATNVTGKPANDVNYIIPRFVLDHLPLGLAGLFIAAVIAAAMNAISGELNSLSTATVIDFYRRWFKPEASDAHFLRVSRWATGLWGVFACVVATYAVNLGSLIEVVNRFGSFFYGSILGVFLLAMIPWASAMGAFVGLIGGMGAVAAVNFGAPHVSYLWQNVVGAVVVVAIGALLSMVRPRRTAAG